MTFKSITMNNGNTVNAELCLFLTISNIHSQIYLIKDTFPINFTVMFNDLHFSDQNSLYIYVTLIDLVLIIMITSLRAFF